MSQVMAVPTEAPAASGPRSRLGPMIVAVGGADSQSVIRAARLLSSSTTSGLLAVRVLEPWTTYVTGMEPMMLPPGFDEEQRLAAARQLEGAVRQEAGGTNAWDTAVVYGDTADALDEMARESNSPMIVMGLGKHPPIDRLLGAETTLRTIRRAPCAVLAVHPSIDPPFRNVVVATDFSPASARALELALPFLSATATVHLVHVWNPASTELASLARVDTAYAVTLPDRFRRMIETVPLPRAMTIMTVTREGKTAHRLIAYAREQHADLIIAGRHGLNALKRMVVGSVTSALVRSAECSVLVAPEPPVAEVDRLRRVLTGTSESTRPSEWGVQLAAFSERNRGRRTRVEVDDRAFGAQVVETGYVLLGAAYDRDSSRVELVLGDAAHVTRQVIRGVGMVDSVTVATAPHGRDIGLRISHGGGETILTFMGE